MSDDEDTGYQEWATSRGRTQGRARIVWSPAYLARFAKQYLKHDVLYRTRNHQDDPKAAARRLALEVAARREAARALHVAAADMPRLEADFKAQYTAKLRRLVRESVAAGRGGALSLSRAPPWLRRAERKLLCLPQVLEEFREQEASVSCRAGLVSLGSPPTHFLEKLVEGLRQLGGPAAPGAFAELTERWGCARGSLRTLWERAQELSLGKVMLQSKRGDRPLPLDDALHVSRADWLVADLALTHDHTFKLLTEESFELPQQVEALAALFQAAQTCALEEPGGGGREAWQRVLHIFHLRGSCVSLVLLQRRWHELKMGARARVADAWRGARGPRPRPIHVAIARRFPHVVCAPLPTWRELVAAGEVYQQADTETPRAPGPTAAVPPPGPPSPAPDVPLTPAVAPAVAPAEAPAEAPATAPEAAPTAPPHSDMDDDLILVEKKIETIDLDELEDTCDDTLVPLVIDESRGSLLRMVKQEPTDHRQELRAQRYGACGLLQQALEREMDQAEAQMSGQGGLLIATDNTSAPAGNNRATLTSSDIIDADESDSDVEIIPGNVVDTAKRTQEVIDTANNGSSGHLEPLENETVDVNCLSTLATLNNVDSERNVNSQHLDTGQSCMSTLEKIDPNKAISSMLIFESDEDDDSNWFPQGESSRDSTSNALSINNSNINTRSDNFSRIESEHSYAHNMFLDAQITNSNSLELQTNVSVCPGNSIVIHTSWINKVPLPEAGAINSMDSVNDKTVVEQEVDGTVVQHAVENVDMIVDKPTENTMSDNIQEREEIVLNVQKTTDLTEPIQNRVGIDSDCLPQELDNKIMGNITHHLTSKVAENQPEVKSTTVQVEPICYNSGKVSNTDTCLPIPVPELKVDTYIEETENNNTDITRTAPVCIDYSERERLENNSNMTTNMPISSKTAIDDVDYQVAKDKSGNSKLEQMETNTMSNNETICVSEKNELHNHMPIVEVNQLPMQLHVENDVAVAKSKVNTIQTNKPRLGTNNDNNSVTEYNHMDFNNVAFQSEPNAVSDHIAIRNVEDHSEEIEKLTIELNGNTKQDESSKGNMGEELKSGDKNIESDLNMNESIKPDVETETEFGLRNSNKEVTGMDISEPITGVVASSRTDSSELVSGVTAQTKIDLNDSRNDFPIGVKPIIDSSEAIEPAKIIFSEFNIQAIGLSDTTVPIESIVDDFQSNEQTTETNEQMEPAESDLGDPAESKLVIDEDILNVDTVEHSATSDSVLEESGLNNKIVNSKDDQPDNKSESEEVVCVDKLPDPKLLMSPRVPLIDLKTSPFWCRYSQHDAIDVGNVDVRQFVSPALAYFQIQVPGKNLANQQQKLTYYVRDLERNPDFDVRLKGLSERFLSVARNAAFLARCTPVTVDVARMRPGTRDTCCLSGRARKKVELPDIEEVRRVNRSLLTAQVAPLSPGDTSEEDEESAGGSGVESLLRERSARAESRDAEDADEAMPTPDQLQQLINTLMMQPPVVDKPDRVPGIRPTGQAVGPGAHARAYCCGARKHRSVNDARRRLNANAGRPPPVELQIHHHPAGEECLCCCTHLVSEEREARARLHRQHRTLQRQLYRLLFPQHPNEAPSEPPPDKPKKPLSQPASTSNVREDPKKKKSTVKKDEGSEQAANAALPDGYHEWIRQKNLATKYFHISPATGRCPPPPTQPQPQMTAGPLQTHERTLASGVKIVKLCRKPSLEDRPQPPSESVQPDTPLANITVELPAVVPLAPVRVQSRNKLVVRVAPPRPRGSPGSLLQVTSKQSTRSVSNLPSSVELLTPPPPQHQLATPAATGDAQPGTATRPENVVKERFASNPPVEDGPSARESAGERDHISDEVVTVLPLTELNVIQHTRQYEQRARRQRNGPQPTDSVVLPLTKENVTNHTKQHEGSQKRHSTPSLEPQVGASAERAGAAAAGRAGVQTGALGGNQITVRTVQPEARAKGKQLRITTAHGDKVYSLVANQGVLSLEDKTLPPVEMDIAISNVVSLAPGNPESDITSTACNSDITGAPSNLEISNVVSLAGSVNHNRLNTTINSTVVPSNSTVLSNNYTVISNNSTMLATTPPWLSTTPIVLPTNATMLPTNSTVLRLVSTETTTTSVVLPTNSTVLSTKSTNNVIPKPFTIVPKKSSVLKVNSTVTPTTPPWLPTTPTVIPANSTMLPTISILPNSSVFPAQCTTVPASQTSTSQASAQPCIVSVVNMTTTAESTATVAQGSAVASRNGHPLPWRRAVGKRVMMYSIQTGRTAPLERDPAASTGFRCVAKEALSDLMTRFKSSAVEARPAKAPAAACGPPISLDSDDE